MSERDEEIPDGGEEAKRPDEDSPETGSEATGDQGLGEKGLESVDLSGENEEPPSSQGPGPVDLRDYDPAEDREKVRGRIAQTLVWLLVGVVGASLLAGIWLSASPEGKIETLKVVLELVLTPLVGLVGAVTGFYFGEKSAKG